MSCVGRRKSAAESFSFTKRLRFSPEFATKLYDAIAPGTTVIVTDQPAVRKATKDFTIMTN